MVHVFDYTVMVLLILFLVAVPTYFLILYVNAWAILAVILLFPCVLAAMVVFFISD